jgi:hypothetical protein
MRAARQFLRDKDKTVFLFELNERQKEHLRTAATKANMSMGQLIRTMLEAL